jgi:hypothetical protein
MGGARQRAGPSVTADSVSSRIDARTSAAVHEVDRAPSMTPKIASRIGTRQWVIVAVLAVPVTVMLPGFGSLNLVADDARVAAVCAVSLQRELLTSTIGKSSRRRTGPPTHGQLTEWQHRAVHRAAIEMDVPKRGMPATLRGSRWDPG